MGSAGRPQGRMAELPLRAETALGGHWWVHRCLEPARLQEAQSGGGRASEARSPPAHQRISKWAGTRPAAFRKGLVGTAEGRRRVPQALIKHELPGGRGGAVPWLRKFLARRWLRCFYVPFEYHTWGAQSHTAVFALASQSVIPPRWESKPLAPNSHSPAALTHTAAYAGLALHPQHPSRGAIISPTYRPHAWEPRSTVNDGGRADGVKLSR